MARKTGAMPTVSIHTASQNARVRIGGKTHWLGRCPAGKVTREQLTKAPLLWHKYVAGELGQEPVPAPPPTPAVTAAPAPAAAPAVAVTEPEAGGITVAALGVRYLDWAEGYYRSADGGTTSSVDGIRMALKALFPFGDLPAATFGPKMLKRMQEMLVREGRPRVTVNRIVRTLRGVFDWATEEELLPVEVWQRLTGARPGEVCLMRPADIDRSADVWVYTPEHHKLEWRDDDEPRRLAIGPECQKLLIPFLLRHSKAYLFSPAGEQYDTAGYRRAIHRARDRAGIERWSPNQLRHLRAGEIKQALGIEVAGAVLGHRHLKTTEIYADRKLRQSIEVVHKHRHGQAHEKTYVVEPGKLARGKRSIYLYYHLADAKDLNLRQFKLDRIVSVRKLNDRCQLEYGSDGKLTGHRWPDDVVDRPPLPLDAIFSCMIHD
jgi:integrase